MTNILTISKNINLLNEISALLDEYQLQHCSFIYKNEDETINFIKENNFDIVLADSEIEEYTILLKKIKNIDLENNIFTLLLYDKDNFNNINNDSTGFIDAFIQKPVLKNILISTVNSYLKIKKNIDKFKSDNKELNKSLYQLDVLYNTSSQLSGNLDGEKVYEIMFETLEKTLSFNTAAALMYCTPNKYNKTYSNRLIVHSLKKPENNVLEILKEKLIQHAKEYNNTDSSLLNTSNITTEEHIKPSYQNEEYDIKLLSYDKLAAPIRVKDKTFGVILIYRNKPFAKEDVVCFQSIVHQVASYLRAIRLYDEIKNANVELKKLERIKSEFVSIVSHELRTPLTPINLSLNFLSNEESSPNAKKAVDMAKRNVTRLTGIIEDLLDLSRIETGKFSFDYKKYNIKTSLDLAYKTFEGQAKGKNIEFSVAQDENLPDIYADPKRIDQILTNITNNAMKFTPNGGKITINATTINADDVKNQNLINPIEIPKGEYIHISIKDTGLGIKDGDIYKIFNKFSQIENSLTRNAGGIGLGLTITKNFIDAHLGSVWVISEENKGSDFNIIIPVFSDVKAFSISLNESKKTTDTTSLITMESNKDLTDFINILKEENIIKTLKNSNEILYTKNNSFIYKIYFKNLQKSALDFITAQIKEKINLYIDSPIGQSYDIVLEKDVFNKEDEIHPL